MSEWNGKTRGGSFGYQFFIYLLRFCGLRAAYLFLSLVVVYFIPCAFNATRASWFYWRKIHKRSALNSFKMLFVHYYRFGQIIIDKVAALSGYEKRFEYEFVNYDRFLEVLNGDSGVVLISAHFGNWEMGSRFFGDYTRKINIVMYDAEYESVKDKLAQTMGQVPYSVIAVNDDLFAHVFKIKDALDRKEAVCFLGDRFVTDKHLLSAEFLGREANFPSGPFVIGSRFKVPVVFYFAEKESEFKYSFRFFEAEPVKRLRNNKPEQQLLSQFVNVLEGRIAVHPEQWLNFYKFWK